MSIITSERRSSGYRWEGDVSFRKQKETEHLVPKPSTILPYAPARSQNGRRLFVSAFHHIDRTRGRSGQSLELDDRAARCRRHKTNIDSPDREGCGLFHEDCRFRPRRVVRQPSLYSLRRLLLQTRPGYLLQTSVRSASFTNSWLSSSHILSGPLRGPLSGTVSVTMDDGKMVESRHSPREARRVHRLRDRP